MNTVATIDESAERAAVLAEARLWLRTPWHHRARVRGVGVDCAQYLIGVYSGAGLVPDFDTGDYPHDWHLHRDRPRFLEFLEQHARQVESPRPGDIAMFRFGRHAAHGSIVIAWPQIVHAYIVERGVVFGDGTQGLLTGRLDSYWRLNRWAGD